MELVDKIRFIDEQLLAHPRRENSEIDKKKSSVMYTKLLFMNESGVIKTDTKVNRPSLPPSPQFTLPVENRKAAGADVL